MVENSGKLVVGPRIVTMRSYMTLSYSDYHFDAGKGSCCDGGGYQKRKSNSTVVPAETRLLM